MTFSMSPFPLRFGSRQGGGGFTPHFWVDSENGDDGNDGASAEAAFQTLGAAETAALSRGNGTKIGLVRGSAWEEDLDLSTLTGAQVRAVGEGAMPMIDGSYLFEGTWDDSTDRADANTNVYSTSVTQTIVEGYITVWPSDGYLKWATSLANCQSTAGTMFIADDATGSNKTGAGSHTIYVHPIGSTNANSDGKTYRITDPTRNGWLLLGAGGTAVGIETRRNLHADGSLKIGANGRAVGCYSHEGVKHEMLLASGRYEYCVAEHLNDDARTGSIVMEFFTSDGSGLTCEYVDSIVIGPGIGSAQVVDGMSGHNQGAGTYYDNITFTRCAAFDLKGTAFGAVTDLGITAAECRAQNCATVYTLNCVGASPVVTDPWIEITDAYSAYRSFVANNCQIDGLRYYCSVENDAIVFGTSNAYSIDASVIVFDGITAVSWVDGFRSSGGKALDLENSIVVNTSAATNLMVVEWYTANVGELGTRSDNVYYAGTPSRLLWRVDGTLYTGATAFLAAYPESGTLTVDPEITDPANGDFSHGSGVTNGAGLARPDVTYFDNPADPRAWIAANAPI